MVHEPSQLRTRHERHDVTRSDALDAAKVEEAVAGTHAVLSASGHTKTSPEDVQTRGTENIVAGMEKHGVRRLVSLTGAGMRDLQNEPGLVNRAITSLLRRLQPDVFGGRGAPRGSHRGDRGGRARA